MEEEGGRDPALRRDDQKIFALCAKAAELRNPLALLGLASIYDVGVLEVEGTRRHSACVTVFLGCGFAAKYRDGGGTFSVPLQWMLGLQRLKLDAVWLELLPATNDLRADRACIESFQRRLREHGLAKQNYCLLHQSPATDAHDLGEMRCVGMSRRELRDRLAGPNTLLNLSNSLHPPFLLEFERRIFAISIRAKFFIG